MKSHQSIVKRLTKANITETQAEAIATEILNSNSTISRDYLEIKFREVTAITEARIEHTRAELLKWFIGIICVQTVTLMISIVLAN